MPRTVRTPPQLDAIFDKAEEYFSRFFQTRRDDPTKGTIEISDERFVLVRGAALSIEFFERVKGLFAHSEQEAAGIAAHLLFDIAHALGKADASHFHKSMGLSDPLSKMSAGPVYFAHTGWAFVDVSADSKLEPNENYYLLYDHPYSFEADAWIRAGRRSDFPVCLMNAGYFSGWCEESFGLPLVASEVSCRAKGDAACRFIMAPPSRIEAHVAHYFGHAWEPTDKTPDAELGKFFKHGWGREALLDKALRDSERDHRNLFEFSPNAVVVCGTNNIIQAANRSAAALLGYEKVEDLVGRSWQDFVVPEERQVCVEAIRRLGKSWGPAESEFTMQRKDTSRFLAECRVVTLVDSEGNPTRFMAAARDITDRKRMEAELRDSERAYRDLFELSPDGIILWNTNDIIQAANTHAATLVGYDKPEDMVGKPWLDFIIPEERAALVEKVRRAQESGGTIEAEFQAIRKDGGRTFFQSRLHVALDKNGNPVQNIAITRDISARKQAEAAMYLSEARFRSAFEDAGHGMALVSLDGRFLEVNATLCRYTGYSEDELLVRTVMDIICPEDLDKTLKIIRRLNSGEISTYETEIRYVRKDGEIAWIQVNSSMVRDAAGAPSYRLVNALDIDRRKRAEAAIYLSEARFRSAFDAAGHGMALANMDGHFFEVNAAFCRIMGYSEEELLVRSFRDIAHPDEIADTIRNISRLHNGEISVYEAEKRYVRKDGRIVWAQLNASMVRDAAGVASYHVTQLQDITARKAAEAIVYLSEARFRSVFESAGHGMALVGLDGCFLKVNPAFCRNSGYSEDEMLARTFIDFVPADDRAVNLEAMRRLSTGEIPSYEGEARYLRKNGEIVWIQVDGSLVRDAAGAPSYCVLQLQDISGRKAAEAALRTQAIIDSLTGLPNRFAFLARLREVLASSRRGGRPFAILYSDLDGFKDVNDTLGHAEGDRLLQAVASRLKSNMRESDFVARFGGDEFAILQADLNDSSDAGVLAAKLTKSVDAPYQIGDNNVHVTVSTGIAIYDPEIADPEAMLVQADLALYRAKAEGRDRYCFHSAELDQEVHERVALTNELYAAIDNHELELYYQPQVEFASGRIVGLEALVRWNHPQHGLLMPDAFIPIAERTRIIGALGHWVLDQACRQIKAWRDQGITPPRLAINVSAAELHPTLNFEQLFAESLKRWSIAPGDIELELTESVLMETSQKHGDILARLNRLGASIAIDDFGTGYSSLAYLSTYPMSCLKIAQQFILGIPDSAKDVAITSATLSLARELGIKVIAEGVETKAQFDFLISAGATVGQGFYFSKAVQAGCATEFLRRGFIEQTV